MMLLRLAIEVRRLDLAAYALVHSAAVVLSAQTLPKKKPAMFVSAARTRAGGSPENERSGSRENA